MEEQAAPEADRIFFYHLPKCAGTSVWETLRKLFGFENVLQIYDRELADRFAKMTPAEKGAYKAIGGHYPLEFYSSQLDLADYFSITMFRDPVERVISEYQYILYNELHPDHRAVSKLSLADFTALPRYSNLMTKWLCGRADAEAAVSVISETFNRWYFLADIETMIADICLCAGQPSLRVPHANAGAPERSPEIDVELIGLIEKRNLADLALYEILTSEREKRLPPSTTTSRSIRAAPLPAFHIVTPCLNAARYIGETIDSVVGQAGNFFIRYHVQDGGSTDGTIAIVKQWQTLVESGQFPIMCSGISFSCESEPDQGMYDAVAKGFERLGPEPDDVMTWINADDRLVPGALNTIASAVRDLPQIDLASGLVAIIDEGGSIRSITTSSPCSRSSSRMASMMAAFFPSSIRKGRSGVRGSGTKPAELIGRSGSPATGTCGEGSRQRPTTSCSTR